jgi:hypothetical protein
MMTDTKTSRERVKVDVSAVYHDDSHEDKHVMTRAVVAS